MRSELNLLKNATRTLKGVVRELLPTGPARDAILSQIREVYQAAQEEIVAEACPAPTPEPVGGHDFRPFLPGRLVMDPEVSDSSPVVRGTWVTASHIVTLIVDGWTWSDILRSHPEIDEDDIRACLAHTVAEAA